MNATDQGQDWAEHIARWQTSKLTRSEYCRQHKLKFHIFVYRLKRHRQTVAKPVTLVPITVRKSSTPDQLVLRGPNGWSLALAADVPTDWLAKLMMQLS